MSREELSARLGYSAALAMYLLGDDSYGRRIFEHPCEIESSEALAMMADIQQRLVVAGILWPDEDPYAAELSVPDLLVRGVRA